MAHEPPFRYPMAELMKHVEACPTDTPPNMVATYFQEQFPNEAEAEWKRVRFLNFQGYLEYSLQDQGIRSEFVTEHDDGLIHIDPSFLQAVWSFLGHAPEHLLGKAPPMPETVEKARLLRQSRPPPQ